MNPEVKLQKLTEMLKILDEGITMSDFQKAFSQVMKLVETAFKTNASEMAKMKQSIQQLSDAVKAESASDMEEIKGQIQLALGGQIAAIQAKLATVKNGRDGKPGAKGDKGDTGARGERGAAGKDGKDGTPGKDGTTRIGWGAHPVTIYNSMVVKDKNVRHINFATNLSVSRNSSGVVTVSATGGALTELTAMGTINSANTSFTFVSKPTYIFIDGAKYRENEGWTWDSGTLTATVTKAPDYSIWGES